MVVPRRMFSQVERLMEEEPAILVQGPRAVGKSTLLNGLSAAYGHPVVDLADDGVRKTAALDPAGYLAGLPSPVLIDEFQRLPQVLSVVKRTVDQRRMAGQFVITGSTTSALLPKGTETLAGRSHDVTLWGFSQGEIDRVKEDFIDRAFQDADSFRSRPHAHNDRGDYVNRIVRGGFPEAVARERPTARHRWQLDYARRVAERDLPELVDLRNPLLLRRVLASCAARTAQLTNLADLANDLGASRPTISTYVELLERVFLVHRLPAYSRNLVARLTRHPKVHVVDTGLAAALCNLGDDALRRSPMIGPMVETFVVGEIRKQLGWSETSAEMFHFRDRDGHEVDLVLEALDGRVVAFEVKAATSVSLQDTKGLRFLADRLGSDFVHGFVLYAGSAPLRMGDDRFSALPISALWA